MKSVILDTNGLLRWLLNDNIDQANQIESLFHQAAKEDGKIIIPQIVIFEIVFALEKYYLQEKAESTKIIRTLLEIPYLQIEEKKVFLVALEYYLESTVSLVDCFLLAKAKLSDYELITFDKKLNDLTLKGDSN